MCRHEESIEREPLGYSRLDYTIGGDLWISPKTGEDLTRCPWLRKLPKNKNLSAEFIVQNQNIVLTIQNQKSMP